jgi:hypothetical protein
LTESKPKPPRSPFDRVPTPKARPKRPGVQFVVLSSVFLTLGIVLAANGTINIPDVEFGSGVVDLPSCIRDTVVDFDLNVSSTGTTIRALEVTGIGSGCANQYLRVSLNRQNGTAIRQLSTGPLGSATTSVDLNVTGTAIDPNDVHGINMELSENPF